jgi:hypothetical protein
MDPGRVVRLHAVLEVDHSAPRGCRSSLPGAHHVRRPALPDRAREGVSAAPGERSRPSLQDDAYERGEITSAKLAEARRSASSVGDLYRVGADIRKAEAAIRAAVAQERMAETLAAVEHGGAALLMLSRLQEGLADGRRRPLPIPGRPMAALPTTEPA